MIAPAKQGVSWDELANIAMTQEELIDRLQFELPGNWCFSVGRAKVWVRRNVPQSIRTGADSYYSFVVRAWIPGGKVNEFEGNSYGEAYKAVAESLIIPMFGSRPVAV